MIQVDSSRIPREYILIGRIEFPVCWDFLLITFVLKWKICKKSVAEYSGNILWGILKWSIDEPREEESMVTTSIPSYLKDKPYLLDV